jgi:hypothetical protein
VSEMPLLAPNPRPTGHPGGPEGGKEMLNINLSNRNNGRKKVLAKFWRAEQIR